MEVFLEILALAVLIGFSALYSGSEIGFYTVSAVQVDLDAQGGSRRARLMQWLLANESALLVTILVGNNLALELATHVGESLAAAWLGVRGAGPAAAIAVTLVLTPLVFLFGEALPKDIFRQRPYALTALAAPVIGLSRVLFWPLERLLRLATLALERALGLEASPVSPRVGRDAVMGFLEEGRRHGALSEGAQALAANALRLRSIPVCEAMVPWGDVVVLRRSQVDPVPSDALFAQLLGSKYSRLPVLDDASPDEGVESEGAEAASGSPGRLDGDNDVAPAPTGSPAQSPGPPPGALNGGTSGGVKPERVAGYVHQLEVLHEWSEAGEGPAPDVLAKVRPMLQLASTESIDVALGKFRAAGRRIGLVVEEDEVVGIVSVNDVLERISGVVVA